MDEAYVLHRRSFKETSLLVEFWSLENGRFTAIAKGAKRPKSHLRGILEPFLPLLVAYQGKHDLKTLTQVDLLPGGLQLIGSQLLAGLYINELILSLVDKGLPMPEIFNCYKETILQLSLANLEQNLRYFEINLLIHLGYGLSFANTNDSEEEIKRDNEYFYLPEHGFLANPIRQVKILKVSGDSIIALKNRKLVTKQQLQEAKKILRLTLAHLLEYRPLKTKIFALKATRAGVNNE